MMTTELALFDLDHTLLDVDSDYLWGEYLVKKGLVDEGLFREKNYEFYQQYIAGTLDALAYNEFVASFLASHTLKDLFAWREDYITHDIAQKIRPKAMQAINQHLQQGHDVLIISATNDFIVKEIAKLFHVPVDNVLATTLQVTEQGYTGKVVGKPNFQEGKIYHLHQWLEKQTKLGKNYTKTYAYSDSKNDLPLLEWADIAICVTPDDILRAYALAHGWAVEDWRIS